MNDPMKMTREEKIAHLKSVAKAGSDGKPKTVAGSRPAFLKWVSIGLFLSPLLLIFAGNEGILYCVVSAIFLWPMAGAFTLLFVVDRVSTEKAKDDEEHAALVAKFKNANSTYANGYPAHRAASDEGRWKDLCAINGVRFDDTWTTKEIDSLPKHLANGEFALAITSGLVDQSRTSNVTDFGLNSWLVILTNKRFLFLDRAMLTSSIDVQSIRLSKVQSVSISQGFVSGKILVDTGSRLIEIDNCRKETLSPFLRIANEILDARESAPITTTATSSNADELKKVHDLYKCGALTEEEFNAAKKRLLSGI